MLLVKPSFEILQITPNVLQLIETAGRVCYKSEDRITDNSAAEFVAMLIKRGHESVLEHAVATVRFICDRGVSHEIVRHRIASYSQESTRYCDYNKDHVAFVIPTWANLLPGEYSVAWDGLYGICTKLEGMHESGDRHWGWSMALAEREYKHLRDAGWRSEQARSVLPNSLKTEIVMTANFREWRHFFKLRTSSAAHPQMRELTIPLLAAMKEHVPVVFDDLIAQVCI